MAAEEYGALNAELAEPEELAAEVVLAYDGLSPTAKVEETEAGAKITVVDKHGTTTATVKNGKDGATGAPGAHIGPEAPTNGEKLWVDTDEAPEGWDAIARFIMETFEEEKAHERGNRQEVFVSWTQGLPSVLDTCYWYNRPAVSDLGAILEETDAEMQKFDEYTAGLRLSRMIYMELLRGCK